MQSFNQHFNIRIRCFPSLRNFLKQHTCVKSTAHQRTVLLSKVFSTNLSLFATNYKNYKKKRTTAIKSPPEIT